MRASVRGGGKDLGGEVAGRLVVLDVVHQLECLEWRVGPVAADARIFAAGHVKIIHQRVRGSALDEGVEGAAVEIVAVAALVVSNI